MKTFIMKNVIKELKGDLNWNWKENTWQKIKKYLQRYALSCWGFKLFGNTVGKPGINTFSFSSPPQRDFRLLFLSLSLSFSSSVWCFWPPEFQDSSGGHLDDSKIN